MHLNDGPIEPVDAKTGWNPVEQGDPAGMARMFSRCLGQYGTGVTIITTEAGGHRAAVTRQFVRLVSLDPPLVLWSITRTSRSSRSSRRRPLRGQRPLGQADGCLPPLLEQGRRQVWGGGWASGVFGSPLVDGRLVHFECETYSQVDGGDHMIILGRVHEPSLYGERLLFAPGTV